MPARFIKRYTRYSLYSDRGMPVAYYHGGFERLDLEDGLSVANEHGYNIDQLRGLLADESEADDVTACPRSIAVWRARSYTIVPCGTLVHTDDVSRVGDEGWCENCTDAHAYYVDCCEEYVTETFHVSGDEVCRRCYETSNYCNACDEYYFDDDESHWNCGRRDCDCDSPRIEFSIPGAEYRIESDTAIDVTLPDGWLDDTGETKIAALLQMNCNYSVGDETRWFYPWDIVRTVGCEWKNSKGTLPKRIRAEVYRRTKAAHGEGLSLSDALVSEIGNIARSHSDGATLKVEITRHLNDHASEFAHEDSCWWGDYSHSRCTLKSNGGFGLRSLGDGYVTGRVWVLPLSIDGDAVKPTLGDADAYLLFNGYSELEEMAGPRVLSKMTGWPHARISFDPGHDVMYVNGNSAHVIAPAEVIDGFKEGTLRLPYFSNHANLLMPV